MCEILRLQMELTSHHVPDHSAQGLPQLPIDTTLAMPSAVVFSSFHGHGLAPSSGAKNSRLGLVHPMTEQQWKMLWSILICAAIFALIVVVEIQQIWG